MNLKLKKIEETSKYLIYEYSDILTLMDKISDKYIRDRNGKFIDVQVKPGLLRIEKGNTKGINGEQIVLEMAINPIKFVEGKTMTVKYLRKVISVITKYYEQTGKYLEEGTFFTNHIGSIYLQDLEDGDIILGDMTKEELKKIYDC